MSLQDTAPPIPRTRGRTQAGLATPPPALFSPQQQQTFQAMPGSDAGVAHMGAHPPSSTGFLPSAPTEQPAASLAGGSLSPAPVTPLIPAYRDDDIGATPPPYPGMGPGWTTVTSRNSRTHSSRSTSPIHRSTPHMTVSVHGVLDDNSDAPSIESQSTYALAAGNMSKSDLLKLARRYATMADMVPDDSEDSDVELVRPNNPTPDSAATNADDDEEIAEDTIKQPVHLSTESIQDSGVSGDSSVEVNRAEPDVSPVPGAHISPIPTDASSEGTGNIAGPSKDKGKGVDPKNWGGISFDETWGEADLAAQRDALANFEEINRVIKEEPVATPRVSKPHRQAAQPVGVKFTSPKPLQAPGVQQEPVVIKLTRLTPAPSDSPTLNEFGTAPNPSNKDVEMEKMSGQTNKCDLDAFKEHMNSKMDHLEQLIANQKPALPSQRAKAKKVLGDFIQDVSDQNPKRPVRRATPSRLATQSFIAKAINGVSRKGTASLLFEGTVFDDEDSEGISPLLLDGFDPKPAVTSHRPRPIGDIMSLYGKFALELAQPFPGETEIYPDRFLLYRISETEYIISDNHTGVDVEIPSASLENPAFAIGEWYAWHRCTVLGFCPPDWLGEERFAVEGRFLVTEENDSTLRILDYGWNMVALIAKDQLTDPDFDLYAWFESNAKQNSDSEISETLDEECDASESEDETLNFRPGASTATDWPGPCPDWSSDVPGTCTLPSWFETHFHTRSDQRQRILNGSGAPVQPYSFELTRIGDMLGNAVAQLLEFCQPYPGDELIPGDSPVRKNFRFRIDRCSDETYIVWDRYSGDDVLLPVDYLRSEEFAIGAWYARHKARRLGLDILDYGSNEIYRMVIDDLLASSTERYLDSVSEWVPAFAEAHSGDTTWMPYAQAKDLTALNDYLETLGISEIEKLGYGSASPPFEDAQVFAGSIMFGDALAAACSVIRDMQETRVRSPLLPATSMTNYPAMNECFAPVYKRWTRTVATINLPSARDAQFISPDQLQVIVSFALYLNKLYAKGETFTEPIWPMNYNEIASAFCSITNTSKLSMPLLDERQFGAIIPIPVGSYCIGHSNLLTADEDIRLPDPREYLRPGHIQVSRSDYRMRDHAFKNGLVRSAQAQFEAQLRNGRVAYNDAFFNAEHTEGPNHSDDGGRSRGQRGRQRKRARRQSPSSSEDGSDSDGSEYTRSSLPSRATSVQTSRRERSRSASRGAPSSVATTPRPSRDDLHRMPDVPVVISPAGKSTATVDAAAAGVVAPQMAPQPAAQGTVFATTVTPAPIVLANSATNTGDLDADGEDDEMPDVPATSSG
ncbi:CCHC-type domain-containing protein [Mycena kentingensis (nom. inval.)]|nr:CCHC-type domain-containing protein [Mycena kentingensis (nom. inval.)]